MENNICTQSMTKMSTIINVLASRHNLARIGVRKTPPFSFMAVLNNRFPVRGMLWCWLPSQNGYQTRRFVVYTGVALITGRYPQSHSQAVSGVVRVSMTVYSLWIFHLHWIAWKLVPAGTVVVSSLTAGQPRRLWKSSILHHE